MVPDASGEASRETAPRALPPGAKALPDFLFRTSAAVAASTVIVLLGGIFLELCINARLSIARFGFSFFTRDVWNPVTEDFGALSSIYGTIVSSGLAMLLAVPLSMAIALFLVELAPPLLSRVVGDAIELLAAIPSIIYGIWGLFILSPLIADHVQPWIQETFGEIPLFSGPPMGIGMMTSGIILGFMILPYICAVTRDVLKMVPPVLKESAYGMGATTWEVTRNVSIPYGLRGIIGAVFLGLGRALGETMAVTFVIGNDHTLSTSLFAAGTTISATLANEFSEATTPMYLSSLVELGLALMAISVVFQAAAYFWMSRLGRVTARA
ncbi:MAG: phosphate ABC transporter permease subunit PstC [Candidatus Hydrogenedentota bacterium]